MHMRFFLLDYPEAVAIKVIGGYSVHGAYGLVFRLATTVARACLS
jgi:hypothetical protein